MHDKNLGVFIFIFWLRCAWIDGPTKLCMFSTGRIFPLISKESSRCEDLAMRFQEVEALLCLKT